jgi:hypothetical protein
MGRNISHQNRGMSATGGDIELRIRDAFDKLKKDKSVHSYELRFIIDGKEFKTLFHGVPTDHHLTNGCVSIGTTLESSLSANSPAKGCFTPTLSKETLPTSLSPTDILQTLSTKLKFAVRPDKPEMVISDVARLVNPATGAKYPSSFSLWRLLRGEPTIYEKYGYTSPELEGMRTRIDAATWRDVKGFMIFGRESLEAFVVRNKYSKHFEDDKLITESMKGISYEEANRVTVRHSLPAFGPVTIIDLLANALGLKGGMPGLFVHRGSDVWRDWDARLRFLSFEEVGASVSATTGGAGTVTSRGGARRKTRRGRKIRRRTRNRS